MVIVLAPVALPGVESEELAADPLGGGHYVLRSIPVVAEGLALGDIISCVMIDERPHVDSVVVPGGNTTLRLLVGTPSSPPCARAWQPWAATWSTRCPTCWS